MPSAVLLPPAAVGDAKVELVLPSVLDEPSAANGAPIPSRGVLVTDDVEAAVDTDVKGVRTGPPSTAAMADEVFAYCPAERDAATVAGALDALVGRPAAMARVEADPSRLRPPSAIPALAAGELLPVDFEDPNMMCRATGR